MFNKPVRAPGNARKEKTREELLAEVRAQRAARGEGKQRVGAATAIQAAWRGWRARRALKAELMAETLSTCSPLVLAAQQPVLATWVSGWLLPRLFFLIAPPPAAALPACAAGCAPTPGAPVQQYEQQQQVAKLVKAALALLIRSCAAADPAHNYLALALHEQQRQQQPSSQHVITASGGVVHQVARLAWLCASVVGGDVVVDAAAVRVLALLLDPATPWKCTAAVTAAVAISAAAGPAPDAQEQGHALQAAVQGQLRHLLARRPGKLMEAAARTLAPAAPAAPATGAVGAVAAAAMLPAANANAPRLLHVCLISAAAPVVADQALWRAVCEHLLPEQALVGSLLPDSKALLRSPASLVALCDGLHACASTPSSTLKGGRALRALANLLALLGPPTTAAPTALQPLGTADMAHAACSLFKAMAVLLTTALKPSSAHAPSPDEGLAEAAAAALTPLSQRSFTLWMLSVAEATSSSSSTAPIPALAPGAPAGSGGAAMAVSDSDAGAVPLLCAVWAGAMHAGQELGKRLATGANPSRNPSLPSMLSALAFTPGVLPRVWRWLASAVGLPVEAPKEATRGLAVASLRWGYQGLAGPHALVLGVFSRLYQHLLMVVDDDEFHARATAGPGGDGGVAASPDGLSVAQARAVAVSLNTLVFHTYLPIRDSTPAAASIPQSRLLAGVLGGPADALLATYAPLLLRSLYERDTRRSFCQAQVWVAPYQDMFGRVDLEVERHRASLLQLVDDLWMGTWASAGAQPAGAARAGAVSGSNSDEEAAEQRRQRRQRRAQPVVAPAAAAASSGRPYSSAASRAAPPRAELEPQRSSGMRGFFSNLLGSPSSSSSTRAQAVHDASVQQPQQPPALAPLALWGPQPPAPHANPLTSLLSGGAGGRGGAAASGGPGPVTAAHSGGGSGGGAGSAVAAGLLAWAAGLQYSEGGFLPGDGRQQQAAAALDPRAALIGPFRVGRVVACLLGGGEETAGTDEEEVQLPGMPGLPALKVRAAEGTRPESLASLLKTAPQAVPFSKRVDIFRALLAEDRARGAFDRAPHEGGARPINITVRRANFMDDAYRQLAGMGPGLKARLHVSFVNEAGLSEAGLDHGGLMKEFLEEVVVRGFQTDAGLWASCPGTGEVYPRPSAFRMDSGAQLLEFLGLMVGKALYEGILLNVAFAPFFVTRLQGRVPQLDDLRTLDGDLHRSLMQVKRFEGDVEALGLTFSVEDTFFGQTSQHALLPGQADTPVNNENRLLYCHLLANWHLNVQLGHAAEAFTRGLAMMVPPASLRLFSPQEFNQLISGGGDDGAALDVADMKRYARYSGGYRPDSSAVKLLWQVMDELTPVERGKVLRFCTSCSRAPLGGFRYLQPPLTVHKVDCEASPLAALGGKDVDRLPTASTCFNTLKLPNYRRKDTLKSKLLQAINSGAGFELS